jgi:hypothetical protein
MAYTTTPTPTATEGDSFEINDILVYPHPNPDIDNSGVTVRFTLTKSALNVRFRLYTVNFRQIREQTYFAGQVKGLLEAGDNEITVEGNHFKNLARGTYYFVLSGEDTQGKKAKSALEPVLVIR